MGTFNGRWLANFVDQVLEIVDDNPRILRHQTESLKELDVLDYLWNSDHEFKVRHFRLSDLLLS